MSESAVVTTLIVVSVWIFFMACFGSYVAFQKGRDLLEGVLFAVFFGPFGLIVVACLPTQIRPEPKRSMFLEPDEAKQDQAVRNQLAAMQRSAAPTVSDDEAHRIILERQFLERTDPRKKQ
jgi:hypothetical protein